jgi:tRNA A-37 threonylcarbamoyl transferase component Bud32
MDGNAPEIQLKSGLHRSVHVRRGPGPEPVVVKVFRSRSWWRRLGDGRRAAREFGMLRRLHKAGLAVPKPLELKRGRIGWELECEWIEDAMSLLQWSVAGNAPSEIQKAIACELGSLLGELHALGFHHGDLHSGNLLLDDDRKLWLIDCSSARWQSPLPDDVIEHDLTVLNGDLRESSSRALRRRCWVRWKRSFVSHGGSLTPTRLQLGERAEANGATRRREALLEHADRWTRESGLCETGLIDGRSALLPRTRPSHANYMVDSETGAVERHWTTIGRAWQHGLPCLTPSYLIRGREPRAGYAAPTGTLALAKDSVPCDQLARAIHDRGLRLSKCRLHRTKDGSELLGPGCEFERVEAVPHG